MSNNWSNITAADNSRQHNGNVYNYYFKNYSLKQSGSDESLQKDDRNRALLKAAAEGQTVRVHQLIEKGADVDFREGQDGLTALHHAVLSGFEDVVKELMSHGADISAISSEVDKLVAKLNESQDQAAKAASGAAEQMRQIEADSAKALAQLTRKHEAERSQFELEVDHAEEKRVYERHRLITVKDQRIAELERAVERTKSDMDHSREKEHYAEARLRVQYEMQTQQMQKEVRSLHEALLMKDEGGYQAKMFSTSVLPSNSDEEIRKHFDIVRDMVDDLSRSRWRKDRKLWSPTVLEQLNLGERQLKMDILKDVIWTQLHRFIFCSPFRVFGKEGQIMEEEWKEASPYGKDPSANGALFNWPVPSIEAERWRAFTIKGCTDALRLPLSSHDPRAKVKEGYKSNIDALVVSLTHELHGLVETSDSDVSELIDKLCRRAATAWLLFGMYQCRIVISLTGAEITSTREKIATVQDGSLELTIQPKVGRHGTIRGLELDSFTTLGGYGGESRPLPDEK